MNSPAIAAADQQPALHDSTMLPLTALGSLLSATSISFSGNSAEGFIPVGPQQTMGSQQTMSESCRSAGPCDPVMSAASVLQVENGLGTAAPARGTTTVPPLQQNPQRGIQQQQPADESFRPLEDQPSLDASSFQRFLRGSASFSADMEGKQADGLIS